MLTGSWQLAEAKAHAFWVAFCPDAKIFRRIHDQLQLWDLRSLSWAVPERDVWGLTVLTVPGWSGSWPPGHPPRACRGPSATLGASL